MRTVLYIMVLVLLLFAPVKRLDVARLEPVQTVAIYTEPGAVVLETDTGNRGRGESVNAALENLEQTTPGVIYLDTAEYLLVSKDALSYVEDLRQYLNPRVKVSLWDGDGSVTDAAKYLAIRSDLRELGNWDPQVQKKVEKR